MLNFIDTKEHVTASDMRPSEAISLDGTYIDGTIEGFRTLGVSGRESLEYSVSDQERPIGIDGMEYFGKRQPSRNLTIKFRLEAPTAEIFIQRYRSLKKFCSGETHEIRFADEPNAHYTGTLLEIEKPEIGQLYVVAQMTFYCADPYLVSDVTTSVVATEVNGILTAHVENDGSAEVYPVYKITNNAENGYVGIVHPSGTFEMGNIDELDAESYKVSERLINGIGTFSDYTGSFPGEPYTYCNGTLKVLPSDSKFFVLNTKSDTVDHWHGGCKKATLPADSEGNVGAVNFYCWFQMHFWAAQLGQTGQVRIVLTDENDAFIISFEVMKSDKVGNTARVYMKTSSGTFKSFKFTSDHKSHYYNSGSEDILKSGGKVRFFYGGKYYTVEDESIASKKVTNIYLYIGQYGTGFRSYVTRMEVGNIWARKDNVEKSKDIPNRYQSGSEIVIDTSSDTIEIDGLPRNEELVTGSEFLPLPVGNTDVEFYPSSWCTTAPTVTVEFKKRWL